MIRVSARCRLRCAYCHADAFGAVACPGCGTLLHPACSAEAGTCPTLGCAERLASAIDPKTAPRLTTPWRVFELVVILGWLAFALALFIRRAPDHRDAVDRAQPVETKITQEIR